jgi:predicted RNA-binding protein with PIN domain
MGNEVMQTHYLIDGYNLLFRLAKSRQALKTKRVQLIEKLNEMIGPLALNATIIFDSADTTTRHSSREHFDALEIVYTNKAMSADAYILEKLDASKYPEHFTVVTSDRDLAFSSKVLKAKTLSVEAFLSLLLKKKKAQKKKTSSSTRLLRDSDAEISRLLRIFEKRLSEDIP